MNDLVNDQSGAKSHRASAFYIDTSRYNMFQVLAAINEETDRKYLKKAHKVLNRYELGNLINKIIDRFSDEIEDFP